MRQIELVILGITGRVGGAVARLAVPPFHVAYGIAGREYDGQQFELSGRAVPVHGPDLDPKTLEGKVIIDCSAPEATEAVIGKAVQAASPMVIATTGHNEEQLSRIRQASASIPVVLESNFSIGMAVIRKIIDLAFPVPESFDISIVERHNANKRDSPSGTAKNLASRISDRYGGLRLKMTPGPRGEREVEVVAVRAGKGGGSEHRILMEAANEEIELRHTTAGSQAYVDGILKAADWVEARRGQNGLYSLSDIIA